ncbi:hypothetical protein ACE6H2_026276 [Prunus campanulata]
MSEYIELSSLGVSRDAQLRASKLLNVVLETGAKEIFEFGYNKLKNCREKLSNTLSLSNRFSLHKIAPQYCTYFYLKKKKKKKKTLTRYNVLSHSYAVSLVVVPRLEEVPNLIPF